MDITIKDEYIKRGLVNGELLVYSYLRNRMEEEGACPDTMERIAKETGVSLRNVFRIMKSLEKKDFIKRKVIYTFDD